MKTNAPERQWENYEGDSSGMHLQWFGDADTTPDVSTAAPVTTDATPGPFLQLDEKTSFNTKEEAVKAFREGTMRHSEHRTAMETIKAERMKHENDRASYLKERQDYEKSVEKYKQLDQILRSNPAAFRQVEQMLRQSPSGTDMQEVMEKLVEEKYGTKFKEMEEFQKSERARQERDTHFANLKKEFPDFNPDDVQKAYDELLQGNMGDFMKVLYYAGKGRSVNPEKVKEQIVETLESKSRAKIPSSKGGTVPTSSDGTKSLNKIRNELKAKLGG